ncbi:MAG: YggS family pyridoxal phosphate-dependent enzyme [Chitinophagaceae bacterium]|nr:YggS family pyridoxal phosphate-dependent enzyme [Chitinophagaceae bacterium]
MDEVNLVPEPVVIAISENLLHVKERIRSACIKSGHAEDAVRLLLATKTVPVERIKIAVDKGETLIGENKVQELKQKMPLLTGLPVEGHFIGHLQTNKIKDVLKYAHCIETVDRLDLAEKLDRRLQFEGRSIDVMIQINTSFEESKFGAHPDEAMDLIKAVSSYDTLKIKGLMTIGLFAAEAEKVRPSFTLLRTIRDRAIGEGILPPDATELSMGMSGDLETAIEEGSTIVRVGTAIFGKRIYPDSYYWNEGKNI